MSDIFRKYLEDATSQRLEANIDSKQGKLTKETVNELIEDFFLHRENQLIKSMEEYALFRAGELTSENKFLKEKLETVLGENRQLLDELRILPFPPPELIGKLKDYEKSLSDLQDKVEELQVRLRTEEEEKVNIIETYKKELEYANRPWWKKWSTKKNL